MRQKTDTNYLQQALIYKIFPKFAIVCEEDSIQLLENIIMLDL